MEELSRLSLDTHTELGPKKTEISYKNYMESIDLVFKKIFLIVAGLLAGISLVYLIFVVANLNNIDSVRNVVLRLDQISIVLSMLSFVLSLNITLTHKDKHLEVLKKLETQKIISSKRKHTKNTVLSVFYGVILGLELIDHRFMVSISASNALAEIKIDNPVVFYGFIGLKGLIFAVVISAWIFVVCTKKRSQTTDSKPN